MSPDHIFPCFNHFRINTLIVFFLIIGLAGCNSKTNKEDHSKSDTMNQKPMASRAMREVTFFPYWVPSVQFAGYYVGVEKGIYAKYGIELHVIPFMPFITTNDLIKSGKADFAALWLLNALELKATGTDIVNIAQPSSRSSLMLLTKKKSGIDKIEKMNGKKLGIWSGFELQPKALCLKYNIDVKLVAIGSTNNLFLMDGVDITAANWFDEYHTIINSGINPDELNTFFFADHGLNFLEDGIYCLSDLRKKDPQLCADFVNATFEGWKYAFEHPEETIDIMTQIMYKAKLPMNRIHQTWMLDRYKDLYYPGENPAFNTKLKKEDYEFVGNVLKNGNLISEIPSFESFYQPIVNR